MSGWNGVVAFSLMFGGLIWLVWFMDKKDTAWADQKATEKMDENLEKAMTKSMVPPANGGTVAIGFDRVSFDLHFTIGDMAFGMSKDEAWKFSDNIRSACQIATQQEREFHSRPRM